MFASVAHADTSASQGTYEFSAGSRLTSDTMPQTRTTLCSILGNYKFPFLPDVDSFTFSGVAGEEVKIKLEANGLVASTSSQVATLMLKRGLKVLSRDRSALPNEIAMTLPKTGKYSIYVHQQLGKKGFKGDYCLTLESSQQGWETLKATSLVE
jgi:hypothetical protein